MRPIFADTFYWVALLNPDDPDHDRVTAFDLSLQRPPLATTEEVLTEFLTYFSGRGSLFRRKAAAVSYALCRTNPDTPRSDYGPRRVDHGTDYRGLSRTV